HLVGEHALMRGGKRQERRIGDLEAELHLGALLGERLLAAEIERVELLRVLAEREEDVLEHERRRVCHALGCWWSGWRVGRTLDVIAPRDVEANPELVDRERIGGRAESL